MEAQPSSKIKVIEMTKWPTQRTKVMQTICKYSNRMSVVEEKLATRVATIRTM